MNNFIEDINLEKELKNNYANEEIKDTHLKFLSLDNITFTKCFFSNIFFEDVDLNNLVFQNCELSNCSFSSGNIENVVFNDCKLSNITFYNNKIKKMDVNDGLMQLGSFNDLTLEQVNFKGKIVGLNFTNLDIKDVDFHNSFLMDWQIRDLRIKSLKLDKARINNIIGDIHNLKNATVSLAQAIDLVKALGLVVS